VTTTNEAARDADEGDGEAAEPLGKRQAELSMRIAELQAVLRETRSEDLRGVLEGAIRDCEERLARPGPESTNLELDAA
jgi:hypothetical protein